MSRGSEISVASVCNPVDSMSDPVQIKDECKKSPDRKPRIQKAISDLQYMKLCSQSSTGNENNLEVGQLVKTKEQVEKPEASPKGKPQQRNARSVISNGSRALVERLKREANMESQQAILLHQF
ncbi:hypothetical protein LAZ67_8001275 [Cordylochernes scorpioides]|uniref:Shootin-1 n=1 Tax=Cordylochernes scorpioides TaxID=51811 RepID=A0ABY6KRN6_9ARAC|nr:hypothetical protein LAZ67_8001275 [Cordylochernes scorpioides]